MSLLPQTSASGAVQAAVYGALSTDATLAALITGVLDDVPEQERFPYVTIGEIVETKAAVFGAGGAENVLTVHVWSRALGMQEGQRIVAAITSVIEESEFTPAGHAVVFANYEQSESMRDPDGITRHFWARYRVATRQTA